MESVTLRTIERDIKLLKDNNLIYNVGIKVRNKWR